jgi:prepilin-type N-terminal cleavage/methylation domain-containing protein
MVSRHQRGFTLIELLLVVAIIGIVAAIATPGLLRARMAGNEASAIGSIRAISTAQHAYAGQCEGYAPVLTELRAAGNYLSPDMTSAAVLAKRKPGAGRAGCGLHGCGHELHRHGCSLERRLHRDAGVRDRREGRDLAGHDRGGAAPAVHTERHDQHHSVTAGRVALH